VPAPDEDRAQHAGQEIGEGKRLLHAQPGAEHLEHRIHRSIGGIVTLQSEGLARIGKEGRELGAGVAVGVGHRHGWLSRAVRSAAACVAGHLAKTMQIPACVAKPPRASRRHSL
jgi:hypothetical protein